MSTHRGRRYWRIKYPTVTTIADPAAILADLATDHPEWDDTRIVNEYRWMQEESARIRLIVSDTLRNTL